jgi:hypothetical protein
MQGSLFPWLDEQLGLLSSKHRRVIAHAFVAKAVYNMSHARELLDRLACDPL